LEIQAVQEKLSMSKKAAIEALIKDRLEKSAINRANITVTDSEVDVQIRQIAQRRGLSKEQMISVLSKKGLTWESYKEQLKTEIKKKKFFQMNIASTISKPTDNDLKLYYEIHKDKFSSDSVAQISMIAYASGSSKKLLESINNPMKKVNGVKQEPLLASSNEMNPALFKIIQQTPEGSFTKPINTGRGFVAYYVKSKSSSAGGFESVKNRVAMQWMQEEQIKAGRNFFNKLKSNADIKVIRL
jgi:parvulin-like peptidyl-prolyl isomerase